MIQRLRHPRVAGPELFRLMARQQKQALCIFIMGLSLAPWFPPPSMSAMRPTTPPRQSHGRHDTMKRTLRGGSSASILYEPEAWSWPCASFGCCDALMRHRTVALLAAMPLSAISRVAIQLNRDRLSTVLVTISWLSLTAS